MNTPAATKKKIAIMVNESSAAKEVGAMVETLRNSELYRAAMAEKARATAMGTPSSRQRNMVPASAAMMPISHCPHMGAERRYAHGDGNEAVSEAGDADLPDQVLKEAQRHESEPYGQDEIGPEVGHAVGRGILRKAKLHAGKPGAQPGEHHGENKKHALVDDPQDVPPAGREGVEQEG